VITQAIEENKVTAIHFVPSMLNAFLEYVKESDVAQNLTSVQHVFTSGEALMPEHVKRFNSLWHAACGTTLHNLYGPTEATVEVSYYDCPTENECVPDSIPIGQPIDNVRLYILDRCNQLVPIGVPGELHIAGDCLARGYLNREELTQKAFVEDPFVEGEKMYKTGDLVRWKENGQIEYLGRIDHQVKIRGYRIELGEIEQTLLQHEMIQEAVVVARFNEAKELILCGYIVHKGNFNEDKLRNYMNEQLPSYMIPAFLISIDEMPLNASGKADRKELMSRELPTNEEESNEEPVTELEAELHEIWTEILGLKRIGVKSSFFNLGGNSLTAIKLISRLQNLGKKVKLSDIFEHHTIRSLAQHLLGNDTTDRIQYLNHFEQVEQLIEEKFFVKCKMSQLTIEDNTLNILTVEDQQHVRLEELQDAIDKNCHPSVQPHYILMGKEQKLPNKNLEADVMKKEWKEKIENLFTEFSDSVLSMESESVRAIVPSQCYHINQTDISGTVMKFEQYMDVENLKKAILKVIREQDLMRSKLIKKDNEYMWETVQCPEDILLPFLDISEFSFSKKQELMDQIIWPYFYKKYDQDSLQYRMILVKESLKDYLLILPFSHSIFDFMSGEIIKNKIERYYNYYHRGSVENWTKDNSYWDYNEQIMLGPIEISDAEIVEKYKLKQFSEGQKAISNFVIDNKKIGGNTTIKLGMEINKLNEKYGDESKLEVPFNMLVNFCHKYFNITHAPILIANYARTFRNKKYFNVIGEFVDYIPIVVSEGMDLITSGKKIKENIELAVSKNISFANLIFNEKMQEDYSMSREYLKESLQEIPIVFNFLGEIRNEQKILQSVDLQEANVKDRNRIICEVWYEEDMVYVALTIPYVESKELLEQYLVDTPENSFLQNV
ncbi:non-ribosomal peptide synthetase, partial [Bacillus sp. 103mf]|uniref:non-ribosomal peptide synthetase n=2 Tax=unclassified Bacillus (in: firmicutes) TaxID=185979 RepID=UPI0008EE6D61